MKIPVNAISWSLVKDTLDAYDVHFRIMFGLDHVLLNYLGVESTEEFNKVIIPLLVEKGLCPVDENGKAIWEVESLDKVGGLNNMDASSKFFALKRAYAQLEAREREGK